jgi:hypothetical protein
VKHLSVHIGALNAKILAQKFCYQVAKIPCYILPTGSSPTSLALRGKSMYRSKGSLALKAALVGLLSVCAAAPAIAQTATAPSTGLGPAWPNATDVSASPNYHVYVFVLNGVKYVQVNDLNGTVHAAIGVGQHKVFVLPVGVDAQNVTTSAAAATSSATQTVYSDATTTITATPQSNGTTQFTTEQACNDPYACSSPAIASGI